MKKITVTLDKVSTDLLQILQYDLDLPRKATTSQSDIVNHVFNEVKMFEDIVGDQITNWLDDNYKEAFDKWLKDNNVQQYDAHTGKSIKTLS